MRIRIVVVGIEHWHDLTLPFLDGLWEHNDRMLVDLVCVDNQSSEKYIPSQHWGYQLARPSKRLGYGNALNFGARYVDDPEDYDYWDWLLCCNNDCTCEGSVTEIISKLSTDTVYGNDWKLDYDGMRDGLPAVVDSAFFLIPRRIWDTIGGFDPIMDAAFEEVDYCIRAINAGFRIDVAPLPITHLNMHTRRELKDYNERWEITRKYFRAKHPSRKEHE